MGSIIDLLSFFKEFLVLLVQQGKQLKEDGFLRDEMDYDIIRI